MAQISWGRMENKVTRNTASLAEVITPISQDFVNHHLHPVVNGNSQCSGGLLNTGLYLPIYGVLWKMARNCISGFLASKLEMGSEFKLYSHFFV